jgi:hypothetical protein
VRPLAVVTLAFAISACTSAPPQASPLPATIHVEMQLQGTIRGRALAQTVVADVPIPPGVCTYRALRREAGKRYVQHVVVSLGGGAILLSFDGELEPIPGAGPAIVVVIDDAGSRASFSYAPFDIEPDGFVWSADLREIGIDDVELTGTSEAHTDDTMRLRALARCPPG